MKEQKNVEIELYRFLMCVAVVILHCSEDYTGGSGILPGGYLAVDFFFIIAGFFLMIHYYKKYDENLTPLGNTIEYFKYRIIQIYPPYFIACSSMIGLVWIENALDFRVLFSTVYHVKWQFLFLHYLGSDLGSSMRSIWYLSPLVLLMWIVYFLCAFFKDKFVGIAPAVSILIYVYICRRYGTLSMQGEYLGWIGGGCFAALQAC